MRAKGWSPYLLSHKFGNMFAALRALATLLLLAAACAQTNKCNSDSLGLKDGYRVLLPSVMVQPNIRDWLVDFAVFTNLCPQNSVIVGATLSACDMDSPPQIVNNNMNSLYTILKRTGGLHWLGWVHSAVYCRPLLARTLESAPRQDPAPHVVPLTSHAARTESVPALQATQ